MIVEEKTLRKVKELGLNSYETKIWTALLSRGVSTAGEISDIANVPRSRSYDVLESLEKKGFIVMKVGKPIQYIAVPPEEVMDRVKKDIKEEAEKKVDVLNEFEKSNMLDELNELYSSGIDSVDPTEITGYVKGRKNVLNHISMMLKEANEDVFISASPNFAGVINENLSTEITKNSDNGVSIKISCPDNISIKGANVKNTGQAGRFIVVDGQKAMFYITSEEVHPSYETAVWVESEEMAKTFTQTFQTTWNTDVKASLKVEKKVKN